MKSSGIITLFTEPLPPRRSPSSVMVSMLMHVLGFGWLFFGLRHTPQINDSSHIQRFTVRLLNAPRAEPRPRGAAGSDVAHSAPRPVSTDALAGGSPASMPQAPQLAQLPPRSQTLVQPDAPPDLVLLQEVPVPLVVVWSPPERTPSKTIVLPHPQEASVATVRPSIIPPNREQTPAEVRISATAFGTTLPALPPSTTTPLVVRGPEPVQHMPATTSKAGGEPTPARVISLSDLRMQEGTVTIPFANAAAPANPSVSIASGRSITSAGAGNGNPASKQTGTGTGQSAGDKGDRSTAAGGPLAQNGSTTGQGSAAGSGAGDDLTFTRITLPKDGKFGVVVVGSSLAEVYPETVNLWGGRLVYTVYLHVGQSRNWILQYSLPRATEAAVAGSASRPEAPWPFDIVRPHFAPSDYTSEAIMVHGFVNLAGRFERLGVVLPSEFVQAKFLLDALQQWQFRPARQNGQLAIVEVLLIIPEEPE